MLHFGYLITFGIAAFQNLVSARFCEGGHRCSPPKECCAQGCCYLFAPPSAPRTTPPSTDHVLNLFFINHWYFWCLVFAIVLAILCACSLWKKRRQLCGWGSPRPHSQSGDSTGSCYAPPQYSRCSSFHHAPPPYTEVTSKPDLYPLVFTCNGDNTKNNSSNGSSYLMVQYFRNYIVRPAGSLSQTSTVDSLSSSFICTANEQNTMVPPPYSRAASPDLPISMSAPHHTVSGPILNSSGGTGTSAYVGYNFPRSASQHDQLTSGGGAGVGSSNVGGINIRGHSSSSSSSCRPVSIFSSRGNDNDEIIENEISDNDITSQPRNLIYNHHHRHISPQQQQQQLQQQQQQKHQPNQHYYHQVHTDSSPVSLTSSVSAAAAAVAMRMSESVNFQTIYLNKNINNSDNNIVINQVISKSDQSLRQHFTHSKNNNNNFYSGGGGGGIDIGGASSLTDGDCGRSTTIDGIYSFKQPTGTSKAQNLSNRQSYNSSNNNNNNNNSNSNNFNNNNRQQNENNKASTSQSSNIKNFSTRQQKQKQFQQQKQHQQQQQQQQQPHQYTSTNAIYNSCGSIDTDDTVLFTMPNLASSSSSASVGTKSTAAVLVKSSSDNQKHNKDYQELDNLRRSLETCCQILQQQQQNQHQQNNHQQQQNQQQQQQQPHLQKIPSNNDSFSVESPVNSGVIVSRKYNTTDSIRSYVNSNTGSGVSSLANIGSPSSPPRATSPTCEVKELLEQIRQLHYDDNGEPTNLSSIDNLANSNNPASSTLGQLSSRNDQPITLRKNTNNEYQSLASTNSATTSTIRRPGLLLRPLSLHQTRKEFFSSNKSKAKYYPIGTTSMGGSGSSGGSSGGGGSTGTTTMTASSIVKNIRSPISSGYAGLLSKTRGRKGWISKSAPTTPATAMPPCFLEDDSPLLDEQDEDAVTADDQMDN